MNNAGTNENTKRARVLAVLRDGPATTGEVGDETGFGTHRAGAHLFHLEQAGKVDRKPFKLPGERTTSLWWLKEAS